MLRGGNEDAHQLLAAKRHAIPLDPLGAAALIGERVERESVCAGLDRAPARRAGALRERPGDWYLVDAVLGE